MSKTCSTCKDVEEWRPIVGFEGFYEVSSHGRVRSLRFINRMTNKKRDQPLILKTQKVGGYPCVWLSKNSKHVCRACHRLVIVAFSGPRPKGKQASHLDGNRNNPHKDNLIWETPKENTGRKSQHGTQNYGERCNFHKLKEKDVSDIRNKLSIGISVKELSNKYGINKATISLIKLGKTWAYMIDKRQEI